MGIPERDKLLPLRFHEFHKVPNSERYSSFNVPMIMAPMRGATILFGTMLLKVFCFRKPRFGSLGSKAIYHWFPYKTVLRGMVGLQREIPPLKPNPFWLGQAQRRRFLL